MKAKNLPTKEEFFKPVLSVFDIETNIKQRLLMKQ